MSDSLLSVDNLAVTFNTQGGDIEAVKGVSFDIGKGENLAIVGESGSGKSVTALSILRLHDEKHTTIPSGKIMFRNQDL